MTNYVFSYRVPSNYRPDAETPAQWRAWFTELGPALVDVGNAVSGYDSIGEVGDSGSRMVGYSLVSATDLKTALGLAADCPALRVGGGVEVGPVMEASQS